MSETRPSSSAQRADDSTNVSLEAGALNQISAPERKQDDREVQTNTNEMMQDFAVYEDGPSPLLESTRTLLTPKVEVARERTPLERCYERTYSRPADPEYARLLGPNAFDVILTAKASTRPDFQKSQSIKKEYKKVSGPAAAGESELPIELNRRRLHKHNTGIRLVPDSQDSGDQRNLNSEPAVMPADDNIWPQGVFGSTSDDEYREIFRRHNFSFSKLPPTKKSFCRVCGLWKPANRDPKFICNDCFLEIPTTNAQSSSSSSLCRRCGNCLLDKPIDGFKVINGRPVCSDCGAVGIQKRTGRALSDQHADHRDVVRGNMIIQPANNKRRRTSSRPPGFVGTKDLLPSLRNPVATVATQKARPNRKSFQEEELIRSHKSLSQQDQQAWQYEKSIVSDNTEPPSSDRNSHGFSEANSRLIDLGIKTAANGPRIWIKVPRNAPLGEMFVAALQSDNALRGYAFMLPGQFVRWDDTPDQVC